jgi:hypothetical protein
MNGWREQIDRAIPISVICWIGFIGAPLIMILAFVSASAPEWVAGCAFLVSACRFGVMLGLWRMRRWAAFAQILLCFCNTTLLIIAGRPGAAMLGLGWYAIELAVIFLYFRRLS